MKIPYFIIFLLYAAISSAQSFVGLSTLRNEADIREQWLGERLESIMPNIMRREGIDMWVIIAREYNEDPVIPTLLPATWMAARRRTILVVYDDGVSDRPECLAVARYDAGKYFKSAWNPEEEPDQWKALIAIIERRNPNKIGINVSEEFALADGISLGEYMQFMSYLPEWQKAKVSSAENLAIAWLETRLPQERLAYQYLCRIAHQIIAKGYSEAVIQPGVTTTEDLVWWFREEIRAQGFQTWFHPSVNIQRADPEVFDHLSAFSKRAEANVIQQGDLLHCDIGIVFYGLHTDTQQHAYVLKPGERDAPASLKKALASGNRLQDILTQAFQTGKTGNEILKEALAQANKEQIKASIYTHPIGVHGHAAGTTIGLWDQQDGVPGKGDYPLYPNTAHAIELNIAAEIPEWGGKEIRIMLEEDAFFDGEKVEYLDGRQKAFHLIPRPSVINLD